MSKDEKPKRTQQQIDDEAAALIAWGRGTAEIAREALEKKAKEED